VYEDAAFREELKRRVLADCRSGDSGRMHWEDIPITRRGRQTTYICARNTPVPGSPLMVSTVWDVTGRKEAEEALREAEQRYRLLVDYSQSIIYTITLEGTLTFASPSWKITLGHEPGEIIGRDFRPLVHAEDRAACEELLRRTAETGAVQPGVEYRVFHKDGSVRWHRSVITPVAAEGRNPTLFVGNAVDITERKAAEAEQERLRDQLMQSQKMESVGRLAGGVAHDFNNMLQAILGYTEMVLDDVAPDAVFRRDLEEIRKIARRAAELTRQLLAFARKQTVSPQVLDLNETVADMTGMLRRLIGEDIGLAWLPGAPLWPVKVDPTQIGMVLANLCVNARDAIQGPGRISIETRNVTIDDSYLARHADAAAGDYVMLAVSDDGHGMDKATLAKVFEPFFTTKGVGKGTGLGLSTVHGIALQNDGFVNAYSEVGEGSTFRVYFPRYLGDEPARTTPETSEDDVRGGRETILVAEDEADILTVCGEVLGRLGYTVLSAGTPGEALELAATHEGPIHLLLTDVVMPEMDGRRLAERVGQLRPGIPCIYMSGYTADAIAHHGILDEGLAFLAKPFANRELAEMVRRVLDGGGV
jgi:PAS domain S-box-containing protein